VFFWDGHQSDSISDRGGPGGRLFPQPIGEIVE
jgi:hypothetical protein